MKHTSPTYAEEDEAIIFTKIRTIAVDPDES